MGRYWKKVLSHKQDATEHRYIRRQIPIYRSVYRCPPSSWLSLRESWREAPERAHCTDSTQKLPTEPPHRLLSRTAFLHELSTHPSPPPFGRYLSRRERQGLCANFKLLDQGEIRDEKNKGEAVSKMVLRQPRLRVHYMILFRGIF